MAVFRKKRPQRSIGEIIKEMVANGESFEVIKRSLADTGIPAAQAEVLVGLYKLRVSPDIEAQIEKTLKSKLDFSAVAEKRKMERREASLQRRRSKKLEDILDGIGAISFPNPAKRSLIQRILADYREMLGRETEIKKELNRALLEALEEKLPRRDPARIRRAIDDLKEL